LASAQLGLARIAQAQGETERARGELARLRRALPGLHALDFELAREQLAAGHAEEARAVLATALEDPHAAPAARAQREEIPALLREAGVESERAEAARHLAARLDVQAPPPGEATTTDLPYLEIRGKAGLWDAALQDVAIALDVSNSTLDASGIDVDGDGHTGRNRPASLVMSDERSGSSDRGDSIVRAELLAAERLIAELDPATTRVSLVLFTATANLAAPLGAPADALAALRRHHVHYDPTGTSFAAPLERAFADLMEHRRPGERSQRTILMLSDGEPTAPSRPEARSRALEVADRLARFGVRVLAFALGSEALEKSDTLREVAERSGGRFAVNADLDDVSFLRDVRLTGLERISIVNQRTGEAARAIRSFPDGSFDALVALAPGANPIEVRAQVADHDPLVVARIVHRAAPEPTDATHAARLAALRETLEKRSQQLAARARLEQARAQRAAARGRTEHRTLEIEPQEAAASADAEQLPNDAQE
jgi:hypothetical protein